MHRIFRAGLGAAPAGLGGASGPGPVALATGPLGRCVVVYFDDILVFSPTKEQHLVDVAETLEILRRSQLYAKRSKCEFGRTEVAFLGLNGLEDRLWAPIHLEHTIVNLKLN